MRFEQLNEGVWAMTYLVVDESTKEAALVDPVYDFMDTYLTHLKTEGLNLRYAIATHTHADHITACFSLREQTGCEYVMFHNTASLGVSTLVKDGDTFNMGSVPFTFHAAPGHTNDSMIVHLSRRWYGLSLYPFLVIHEKYYLLQQRVLPPLPCPKQL